MTPEEFDQLPALVLEPAPADFDDDQLGEFYGAQILAFDQPGMFQVWYPTSTVDNYDVVQVVDGVISTVDGEDAQAARA